MDASIRAGQVFWWDSIEVEGAPPIFELGGTPAPQPRSSPVDAAAGQIVDRKWWPSVHPANTPTIRAADYIESPLFLRNAGTSKSACSKFAIMALRMLSSEMTSPEAAGAG
jgi:hypothetical protein